MEAINYRSLALHWSSGNAAVYLSDGGIAVQPR
jgi:hypothetical protein